MLNVLAIDPSLRATGWATIAPGPLGDDERHHGTIDTSRIKSPVTGRRRALRGAERLGYVTANIVQLTRRHATQLVALEGYSFSSQHSQAHALGELGGAIRLILHHLKIPYLEVAPKTLKLWATGSGNADKDRMVTAARDLLNYRGHSNDEADALLLHALVADAMGLGYATPDHARTDEALAPVVAALTKIDLLPAPVPTGDH